MHCWKYFLVLLIYSFSLKLQAQIDTITICNPGDPVQLQALSGMAAYQWEGEVNFENPTIANPIVYPLEPTIFTVTMLPEVEIINLITNPDFEEGNTGFISDYDYGTLVTVQGAYGVNESAENLNHLYFEDCPDHTSGQGMMMVVDGSPVANEKVWCQTIAVQPEKDYAFSAWLTSVKRENPALLQFSINDEALGEPFRAGSSTCDWRQFFEIWNAENNTEAQICIINQNLRPDGNDFALDDFLFYELEEALYDTTMVVIEALIAAKERRYYFPNAFSPNFDGRNDYFQPYFGKGVSQVLEFKIFNRWGSVIYAIENCDPNDLNCRWDGRFKGKMMPAGIYLYYAKIKFSDKSLEQKGGDFLLIR